MLFLYWFTRRIVLHVFKRRKTEGETWTDCIFATSLRLPAGNSKM